MVAEIMDASTRGDPYVKMVRVRRLGCVLEAVLCS